MPREEKRRYWGDVCIGYLLSTPWEDGTWRWLSGKVLVDLGDCGK